jgi:hypothetical protein
MSLRAWGSDSAAKTGSGALFDNRVDSWVLGREGGRPMGRCCALGRLTSWDGVPRRLEGTKQSQRAWRL